MFEFKGTPGPWEWDENLGLEIRHNGKPICAMRLASGYHDAVEQDENAKLISQSPDLLQKSQDLLTWLHVTHPETGEVHCLACRGVTDPEAAGNGQFSHHEECPVVPLAKVIYQALGIKEETPN